MLKACRLCGSEKLELYYTEGNEDQFHYYRCSRCLLVNYDMESGFDQGKHELGFIDPLDEKHKSNRIVSHSFDFLSRFTSPPGDMLDIGCNNGRLIYLARKAGWEVTGMDLFESLSRRVMDVIGERVIVADFLEYTPLDGRKYDVIVLRHVLEHLPDPVRAMRKIRELLKPGGLALLEFPNTASIELRFKWWLRRTNIYRKRFDPSYVPHHCNEFRREPFELLCSKTGFTILQWKSYSSNAALNPLYGALHYGNKVRALVAADGRPA